MTYLWMAVKIKGYIVFMVIVKEVVKAEKRQGGIFVKSLVVCVDAREFTPLLEHNKHFLVWCKMATPSPRKFQEKIALLQQKEAEAKIAYDNIMNEVQGLRMHVRGHLLTGEKGSEEGHVVFPRCTP